MAASTKDSDTFLYIAKLAEQAERYDEIVDAAKKPAKLDKELTAEEQNLLSIGEGDYYRCLDDCKVLDESKYLAAQSLLAFQPGPHGNPQQCLVRRNKKTSTFYLYLAISPSLTDMGKFLLAARRCRYGTHTEYIISLDAGDFSQGSNAYVGKLRSDFLGTNFTIYKSQPSHDDAKPSDSEDSRCFGRKQICPQVLANNFEVGRVSYKTNLFKPTRPRRMVCSMKFPWAGEIPGDTSNTNKLTSSFFKYTVLQSKVPRMHETLKRWCLNFHGRVTMASINNFQLIATADQNQAKGDEETLLQFGKVGNNIFTMDYKHPFSAFHAFAICLTSFSLILGNLE